MVSFFLGLLPWGVVQNVGRVLGRTVLALTGFRCSIIAENIQIAFGLESADSQKQLTRDIYEHFGMTVLEDLVAIGWKPFDYRTKVKLHGFENIEPFLKEGKGGFFRIETRGGEASPGRAH